MVLCGGYLCAFGVCERGLGIGDSCRSILLVFGLEMRGIHFFGKTILVCRSAMCHHLVAIISAAFGEENDKGG